MGSSTRNYVIADLRPNSEYLVIVDTQNAAGSSASEVEVSTASAGNFFSSKGALYQPAKIALQVHTYQGLQALIHQISINSPCILIAFSLFYTKGTYNAHFRATLFSILPLNKLKIQYTWRH